MEHLTLEQLARLVDEAPTADEAAHLQGCPRCRDQLAGLVDQTAALATLDDPALPAGLDERVLAALSREGLVVEPSSHEVAGELSFGGRTGRLSGSASGAIASRGGRIGRPHRGVGGIRMGQIAAGFALFVLGAATGAVAMRRSIPSVATATVEQPASDDVAAAAALRSAEAAYLKAIETYSTATGATSTSDPVSRLAALEGIVLTTRAALEHAPADPVINNYHLTALAQRNALMRQIESAATDDEWF